MDCIVGDVIRYEQIESELETFAQQHFTAKLKATETAGAPSAGLMPGRDFKIAVCGLKLRSEHEDDCIATVELITDAAKGAKDAFTAALTVDSKRSKDVGKASVPNFVRFAEIPRNFKGAILVKELVVHASAEFPKGSV